MKLKETAEALKESLWKITGGDGKNAHVHRYDPARRRGKTTIDENHYHYWKNGEEYTTDTVSVPAEAEIEDHQHTLESFKKAGEGYDGDMMAEDDSAARMEEVMKYLSQLNDEDVQKINTFGWAPKANVPLSIQIVARGMGTERSEMMPARAYYPRIESVFYDTKDATAIRQLGMKIAPLVEKMGLVANYYVSHPGSGEPVVFNELDSKYLVKVVATLRPYTRAGCGPY